MIKQIFSSIVPRVDYYYSNKIFTADGTAFIDEVKRAIDIIVNEYKFAYERVGMDVMLEYNTSTYEYNNVFINEAPNFMKWIMQQSQTYISMAPNIKWDVSLNRENKNILYLMQIWPTAVRYGENVVATHHHEYSDSVISGTFYVDADEEAGNLTLQRFSQTGIEVHNEAVSSGKLILFPANVMHGVLENKSQKRIGIAFDIGMIRQSPVDTNQTLLYDVRDSKFLTCDEYKKCYYEKDSDHSRA